MTKKSERLSMGRKKRQQNDGGVTSNEIVDVERNPIETWLLNLKHWATNNRQKVRLIVFSSLGSVLFLIIILYVYSLIGDRHNIQFYSMFDTYTELKLKDVEKRKKDFEKLATDSDDLCQSFISTTSSYNGCLINALAHLELGQQDKFAAALERYGAYHDDDGLGSYILFYAAYAYEQAYDLDKAYEIYGRLEQIYSVVEKADVAKFHLGRIDYLRANLDKAEKTFKKILKDHAASQYRADAQKYLMLIAAMRSQNVDSLKKATLPK